MLEHGICLGLLTEEEDQSALFRTVGKLLAKRMTLDGSLTEIRYKHQLSDSRWVYGSVTAMPLPVANKRRKLDRSGAATGESHCRWLYSGCRANHGKNPVHLLTGTQDKTLDHDLH